ncbi:hypothetical protein [Roseateles saccharophilus]|uniref:Lipoprotein n=1 Tax=Roseateles saccharophilus TaxID=304 RepID=A0A4R3VKA4_ROSSA|nr:hypothetical protein [Roseateles saccharophilus]MDG0831212.1 hypothetical protein [Roseateles saccharophilus]TCV04332.1 hypothetical protein EV671_100187 [Roseateles saccharophilus]
MKPQHLFAALLVSAALASCAQTPPPSPAASAAEPESQRLSRELQAAVGTAACTADSQCSSLAVGAKACGGPAGYLAWSSVGTDAARLKELAARLTEAQRRENVASGLRSNCAFVADPGAVCVAGRCQLATPASLR